MARTRNLQVVITGDASGATKAFKQVDSAAGKTETRMGKVGTAFKVAGAAAGGAMVIGLKRSADAAIDAQKSQAAMEAQLKTSGISYQKYADQINTVIQRTSQLAAVDDEDLQDAFTNIVRTTGDVEKALKLVGLAADVAAARHINLRNASDIVAKVAGGNTGILSRYGITIQKGATATEALATLQQRFGGQAAAYGKTTAGALDRIGVASENLQEAVGAKLVPVIASLGNRLANLINWFNRNQTAAKALGIAMGTLVASLAAAMIVTKLVAAFATLRAGFLAARTAALAMNVALAANPIGLVIAAVVALGLALIVAYKRSQTFRNIVDGAFKVVKDAGVAVGRSIEHWVVDPLKRIVDAATAVVRAIGKVVHAFGSIGGAAKDIGSFLNPFGDGLGKVAGSVPSFTAPLGTGPLGGLHGADGALSPFAAIGARAGLHVSSGRFDHSTRTSTGNISYHSTGEAIDLANGAGPDAAKLGVFRTLKSRFGSRLAELIYTPGGQGIKDGRPFTYTGKTAAEHFDHVHVALDLGKPGPGIGDGPGRKRRASDDLERILPRAWGIARRFLGGGSMPKYRIERSGHIMYTTDDGVVHFPRDTIAGILTKKDTEEGSYEKQGVVHEWAHAYQRPGLAYWASEGGAQLFARRVAPTVWRGLGYPFHNGSDTNYSGHVQRVKKLGETFWREGQFMFGRVPVPHAATVGAPTKPRMSNRTRSLSGAMLAADAARKAGFRGSDLVTMVAIAGRESQWNPRATNFKYPDHSIGLWQINQLAHKGRFGTDAQLMDPFRNARAAYTLFKQSGLMPWSTRNSYGPYVSQARQAVIASRSGGASAPTGGGGSTSTGAADAPTTFERQTSAADLAIAEATPGGDEPVGGSPAALNLAAADRSKRLVINKRIRKVRAALKKKGLRPATRVRLQGELADLIGQSRGLLSTEQGLKTTPAADDTGDGSDPNQALIDSNQALADAIEQDRQAREAHTAALQAVRDAIDDQTKTAVAFQTTQGSQALRYVKDLISGAIVSELPRVGRNQPLYGAGVAY